MGVFTCENHGKICGYPPTPAGSYDTICCIDTVNPYHITIVVLFWRNLSKKKRDCSIKFNII